MMPLTDASRHDWLEGRRHPQLALIGFQDDATSQILAAHFQLEAENTVGYLRALICQDRPVSQLRSPAPPLWRKLMPCSRASAPTTTSALPAPRRRHPRLPLSAAALRSARGLSLRCQRVVSPDHTVPLGPSASRCPLACSS